MKRILAFLLAFCLAAGISAIAATAEANVVLSVGSTTFPVPDGQDYKQNANGTATICLNGEHSAVSVILIDMSGYMKSMRANMPPVQQGIMVEAVKKEETVDSKTVKYTVLGSEIEFEEFTTKDGTFWSIGTFADDPYLYTIIYASDIYNDAEKEKYSVFIGGIGEDASPADGTEETEAPRVRLTEEEVEACTDYLTKGEFDVLSDYLKSFVDSNSSGIDERIDQITGYLKLMSEQKKKFSCEYDKVEKRFRAYCAGVEEISNEINVVPMFSAGRLGCSHGYKIGFQKDGWLFFNKVIVASDDRDSMESSVDSWKVNHDVLGGGMIQETIFTSLGIEDFASDQNVIIRFKNTNTGEALDHMFTPDEISAIVAIDEFTRLYTSAYWGIQGLSHD